MILLSFAWAFLKQQFLAELFSARLWFRKCSLSGLFSCFLVLGEFYAQRKEALPVVLDLYAALFGLEFYDSLCGEEFCELYQPVEPDSELVGEFL